MGDILLMMLSTFVLLQHVKNDDVAKCEDKSYETEEQKQSVQNSTNIFIKCVKTQSKINTSV